VIVLKEHLRVLIREISQGTFKKEASPILDLSNQNFRVRNFENVDSSSGSVLMGNLNGPFN
jgi:hypothetical protein